MTPDGIFLPYESKLLAKFEALWRMDNIHKETEPGPCYSLCLKILSPRLFPRRRNFMCELLGSGSHASESFVLPSSATDGEFFLYYSFSRGQPTHRNQFMKQISWTSSAYLLTARRSKDLRIYGYNFFYQFLNYEDSAMQHHFCIARSRQS